MKILHISVLVIFYSLQSFSSSINGKSLICSATYDISKNYVNSLVFFHFYENTFDQYVLNDTKNDDKKFIFIKYEDKLPHNYILNNDTLELNYNDMKNSFDSIYIDRFTLEVSFWYGRNYNNNLLITNCNVADNQISLMDKLEKEEEKLNNEFRNKIKKRKL